MSLPGKSRNLDKSERRRQINREDKTPKNVHRRSYLESGSSNRDVDVTSSYTRSDHDNKVRPRNLNSETDSGRNNDNTEIDSNIEPTPGPSREYYGDNQRRNDTRCNSSNTLRVNARGFERMTISPRASASVAWTAGSALEGSRSKHSKIRSSLERSMILKEHRTNTRAGAHTKSGYRKSNSRNTEEKHSKLKDSEVSLKRKLMDAESNCIKLERKLRAKNLALSKRMESEKSLEQLLSKASSEKVSFRDKWMDLKRVKASLKDQVEKHANEIKSLKRKLANSEDKANKAITDKALLLKQSEEQPSTHNETHVDGNLFQDMLENFKNVLESNLQCSVCSEVYAFSVTITCGHTFCLECIEEWKLKKRNCPICRASITSQLHTKVLDDYIDKFVDGFAPDTFKIARKELLEERKRKEELRKQRERSPRRERNNRLNRNSSVVAETNSDYASPSWAGSPIRLSPGLDFQSLSSNSMSSFQRNRFESDGSESDTTWNPTVYSALSVRSDIRNQSRNATIDLSGFWPSSSRRDRDRTRTRSSSTNRSLPPTTSAAMPSLVLSRSSSRSSSQARNDRNRSPSPSILDLFSRHDGLDDSINEVRNEALDNSSDSTYSPGSIRNVNGGNARMSRNSTPSIRHDSGSESDNVIFGSFSDPSSIPGFSENSNSDESD